MDRITKLTSIDVTDKIKSRHGHSRLIRVIHSHKVARVIQYGFWGGFRLRPMHIVRRTIVDHCENN